MIDTHSHIYLEQFEEDMDQVLERAANEGVTDIFLPAIDFQSIGEMEELSHPDIRFYKMAGLHPADIKKLPFGIEDQLFKFCSRHDMYGVGETGLDYYWSTEHVKEQKKSLHLHCQVAKQAGKPIILHNRESTEDLLFIIEEEQDGRLSGIWHCFNGSAEEGRRAIDLGLHLGIGGVVTFKNAGVDKAVAELPLDKMVLETDAPYLSPTPKRGTRNEPAFMTYTARKLAGIFEMSQEEVIQRTSEVARKIFNV